MKNRFKKGGIPALEWGQSTTRLTKKQRRHYRINLENNKYETMSREELIERAKLGDALKKHETVSTKNKYFLIDTLKANYTIRFLCSLLKVSRFGFYQWLKKGKPEFNNWDWELAEKIKNLYIHYQKVYGYNMISMLINRFYSIKINPWIVYRYMKNMKIRALIRKRNFKYREKGITSQYENIMNRNFYA